jgi:hypothetical protein
MDLSPCGFRQSFGVEGWPDLSLKSLGMHFKPMAGLMESNVQRLSPITSFSRYFH